MNHNTEIQFDLTKQIKQLQSDRKILVEALKDLRDHGTRRRGMNWRNISDCILFFWMIFYVLDVFYLAPRRRKKYKNELVAELHKQLKESDEVIFIKDDKVPMTTNKEITQ